MRNKTVLKLLGKAFILVGSTFAVKKGIEIAANINHCKDLEKAIDKASETSDKDSGTLDKDSEEKPETSEASENDSDNEKRETVQIRTGIFLDDFINEENPEESSKSEEESDEGTTFLYAPMEDLEYLYDMNKDEEETPTNLEDLLESTEPKMDLVDLMYGPLSTVSSTEQPDLRKSLEKLVDKYYNEFVDDIRCLPEYDSDLEAGIQDNLKMYKLISSDFSVDKFSSEAEVDARLKEDLDTYLSLLLEDAILTASYSHEKVDLFEDLKATSNTKLTLENLLYAPPVPKPDKPSDERVDLMIKLVDKHFNEFLNKHDWLSKHDLVKLDELKQVQSERLWVLLQDFSSDEEHELEKFINIWIEIKLKHFLKEASERASQEVSNQCDLYGPYPDDYDLADSIEKEEQTQQEQVTFKENGEINVPSNEQSDVNSNIQCKLYGSYPDRSSNEQSEIKTDFGIENKTTMNPMTADDLTNQSTEEDSNNQEKDSNNTEKNTIADETLKEYSEKMKGLMDQQRKLLSDVEKQIIDQLQEFEENFYKDLNTKK